MPDKPCFAFAASPVQREFDCGHCGSGLSRTDKLGKLHVTAVKSAAKKKAASIASGSTVKCKKDKADQEATAAVKSVASEDAGTKAVVGVVEKADHENAKDEEEGEDEEEEEEEADEEAKADTSEVHDKAVGAADGSTGNAMGDGGWAELVAKCRKTVEDEE